MTRSLSFILCKGQYMELIRFIDAPHFVKSASAAL